MYVAQRFVALVFAFYVRTTLRFYVYGEDDEYLLCHVLLPLQLSAAKLRKNFGLCKKNEEKLQKLIV